MKIQTNKITNKNLDLFKIHKSSKQIMADSLARSAGKAFKQGSRIKGKLGKALGLGAAALQIYEDWKQ